MAKLRYGMNHTISHDLKSPIITVRGFLGRVERDVARGDSERLKSNLQLISKAAARMEELTDQLSLFTLIGQLSEEIEEAAIPSGDIRIG
jgi:C4-dicarboxylate-specific signal transduction histidine kinase